MIYSSTVLYIEWRNTNAKDLVARLYTPQATGTMYCWLLSHPVSYSTPSLSSTLNCNSHQLDEINGTNFMAIQTKPAKRRHTQVLVL